MVQKGEKKMNVDYEAIKTLMKEKKYNEISVYLQSTGAVTIPQGLVGNPKETKRTIEALKFLLQLQTAVETGKYVYSDEKGLRKWIKHHFFGYIEIEREN